MSGSDVRPIIKLVPKEGTLGALLAPNRGFLNRTPSLDNGAPRTRIEMNENWRKIVNGWAADLKSADDSKKITLLKQMHSITDRGIFPEKLDEVAELLTSGDRRMSVWAASYMEKAAAHGVGVSSAKLLMSALWSNDPYVRVGAAAGVRGAMLKDAKASAAEIAELLLERDAGQRVRVLSFIHKEIAGDASCRLKHFTRFLCRNLAEGGKDGKMAALAVIACAVAEGKFRHMERGVLEALAHDNGEGDPAKEVRMKAMRIGKEMEGKWNLNLSVVLRHMSAQGKNLSHMAAEIGELLDAKDAETRKNAFITLKGMCDAGGRQRTKAVEILIRGLSSEHGDARMWTRNRMYTMIERKEVDLEDGTVFAGFKAALAKNGSRDMMELLRMVLHTNRSTDTRRLADTLIVLKENGKLEGSVDEIKPGKAKTS